MRAKKEGTQLAENSGQLGNRSDAGGKICYGCMTMQNVDMCPLCGYSRNEEPSPVYLRPGTVLAKKYLIGKVIGHGGFGVTYLAYDTVLGIKLAVKEYLVQEYASRGPDGRVVAHVGEGKDRFEEGISRFLEEARSLAKFEGNPGIVSVRDFFRANGTAYLVMIYLEGMNLRQYLAEKGPMPYERVQKEILPVVTGALTAVHGAGMLHRDISPDNIFLTKQGQVRVIDFGAARQVLSSAKSMSIILKPGYAPEEQYRSHGKQGPWTDVYAVAATVYRAITGKVPPESLDRLANDTLEPPSKYCSIPPAQEQVLLKAMSIKAENRYQSMLDFYNAILAAQETPDFDEGTTMAYRGTHNFQGAQNTSRNEPVIPAFAEAPLPAPQRLPVKRPQPPQPAKKKRPVIEPMTAETGERRGGQSKGAKATYSVIKILIAVAVILAVIAVAIVLIKLIFNQITGSIPDILKPPATTAMATQSPGATDGGVGITASPDLSATPDPNATADPNATPSEDPELTETPDPVLFPDVSGIVVNDMLARGDAVANALAYVPTSNRDITYGVAYPTGNLIYFTAKPSSGNVIVSRFITDGASLERGKVEHFFSRDGSLYCYTESIGVTSLIVPAGAKIGMSWSDDGGNKEIVEVSWPVTVRGTTYEDCLIIKIGTMYVAYKTGVGEVAAVDDYMVDSQNPQIRLRYNDTAGKNMTPELEKISTQHSAIQ